MVRSSDVGGGAGVGVGAVPCFWKSEQDRSFSKMGFDKQSNSPKRCRRPQGIIMEVLMKEMSNKVVWLRFLRLQDF
jgi:hypothetical protein